MSATTPSRSHAPTGSTSRTAAGPAAAAAAATAAEYTPGMRDRQARGKDPYKDSESDDYDDGPDRRVRLGRGIKTEPFEDKERRGFALSVLDCPESLMMYAQSAGDSVPGQRLRFTAMLCGFEDRRKSKDVGGRERDKERDRERRR